VTLTLDAPTRAGSGQPAATQRSRRTRALLLNELHPGAWWVWGLCLALAASRTTNPLLLGLVLAVTALVAAACRRPSPWSRAYRVFLLVGVAGLLVRVPVLAVAGYPVGTHLLLTLPVVHLPSWVAGVRLGGPVTGEQLVDAALRSLQLLAILASVAVVNVVTTPSRLVKALPAALYEAGLVVTVAVSMAPQAVASLGRVRGARRLRGRPTSGLAAVRGIAVPVLEGALEQSLGLAAALDSRGYGRRVPVAAARRRLASAAALGGLLLTALGAYAALGGGVPAGVGGDRVVGGPGLALGALLLTLGLVAGGARSPRTRYRGDRWDLRATAVAAAGALVVAVSVLTGRDGLLQPTDLLAVPRLPLLPAAAVLLAALPALLAPAPVLPRAVLPAAGEQP